MTGASGEIVRAAIYPAIGIARVGNSPEEWFLGPEVPEPPPQPSSFYRDGSGALKRQAARFRVYGLDARGRAVAELTGRGDAEVTWTVHLANTKAAWYEFQLALDIPEAASAPPSYRRNAQVADRRQLVIDPGPRSIEGADHRAVRFDGGHFMGKPVYLGELRTDEAGRLIVLGGHGKAASYNNSRAVTFANNDGWHDDIADGPVTACVSLGGKEIPVDPAWLVVAPPNYGPCQKSVRTMWDLMRDLALQPEVPHQARAPVVPARHRPDLQAAEPAAMGQPGFCHLVRLGRCLRFRHVRVDGQARRSRRGQQGATAPARQSVPRLRPGWVVAGALAVGLWRRHERADAQDAASVHRAHPDPVGLSRAVGGRRLRRRLPDGGHDAP